MRSTERHHYHAVVVGSGFGGSIAALRLAEAGRSVLVLERGRRYTPGEFPREVTDVDRLFWRYRRRRSATGLFDLQILSGIGVVVASGVGGGSLIYANIHIRPDPVVFEDERWPSSITRETLDPYYDRVAQMLGVRPLPTNLRITKRDVYREAAAKLGRPVFDPDQAVTWEASADQHLGVGRGPCQLVAECEFGCQHGAKNTMDLTYLNRAEELGAEVRTGALVSHVASAGRGYRVVYRDVHTGLTVEVTGTRVVLAAGTLGTNAILLRSRDQFGTLPKLSPTLGHGFSGNGDYLGSIQNSSVDLDPGRGPDVTSVIKYFDADPRFTMAAPTFSDPVMEVLASQGQPDLRWLRFLSPLLWPRLGDVVVRAFRKGLLSRPSRLPVRNAGDYRRMTNLFAIGQDNANGRMRLRRGELDVQWSYARENAVLVDKMEAAMEAVADVYGGTFAPVLTWKLFRRILTVHPLGGCRLSESPHRGVVSLHGEVHSYPGLYVMDGSVIPSAIGFHPVMTISALAERSAEAMVSTFPS